MPYRERPRSRHDAIGWCALLALAALLASCGGAPIARARATPTPRPTATPSGSAAQLASAPPPYGFPARWQTVPSAPANVTSMQIAPSDPRQGYACASQTSDTSATATAPTATPSPVTTTLYTTSDGGQSWSSDTSLRIAPGASCQIFVDQQRARDVFVFLGAPGASGTSVTLSRSTDGGASWSTMALPQVPGYTSDIALQSLAVVGSRIIVTVIAQGEGAINDPLYASDDDGQSWQPIASHLSYANQPLAYPTLVAALGATLVIAASPPCQGCGLLERAATRADALDAPSAPFVPRPSAQPMVVLFASTDGGTTWVHVPQPTVHPTAFAASRLASGADVLAMDALVTGKGGDQRLIYLTRDAGQTWQQLPAAQGLEGGYPDPSSLGLGGALLVASDGTILAGMTHPLSANGGESDAGIFRINPSATDPHWQALAPNLNYNDWQAVPDGARTRVLALANAPAAPGATVVALTLPPA